MTTETSLVPMHPAAKGTQSAGQPGNRVAPSPGIQIVGPASLAYPPDARARPLIVQYLDILRRRKWTILAVLAAALMLALAVTMLTRPTFTAVTQLQVSREGSNVTDVRGVESENVGRDLEFYQTQYELLEARSLAQRVARSLQLGRSEDFWNAHGIDPEALEGTANTPVPALSAAGETSGARERLAVATLLENIAIDPIRGSALIDVGYSSFDPVLSARIANAWVDEFIAQSVARKFDSTAEARSFLEERLGQLRGRVEESERALVDYATDRGIVTLTSDASADGTAQIRERTLAAENLEGLNAELIAATGERVRAQAAARNSGVAQTSGTVSRLREQRAVAAGELAQLEAQFEPAYPRVLALRGQVAELDRAIAGEEARIRREGRETLLAAQRREGELRARVNGLAGQVLAQRRDAIQYNIFQREADTNRQLYDSLLQRYKEIGVAGVSASNIAIIDTAQAPSRPSSPSLLLNLALAFVAGTIAAGGLVVLLEQSSEGLTDPGRVPEALGIPLLGSVPKLDDGEDPIEFVADPKTEIAESYIAIRSSLGFSTTSGIPRSFMLVSSQPAEGKSLSAMALSLALGRMGKRVLLVDADLRNPSAHSYLGLHRKMGLSNYLAGDDDTQSLIQPARPGVDLMASGPSVPSAADLFASGRLAELVRLMGERYDHVVVDSAPVIGLADAPLVSQAVDAAIFVVEAGKVPVRGLNAALERMTASNTPIIGVILTKLDAHNSHYGYGYDYSYSYASRAIGGSAEKDEAGSIADNGGPGDDASWESRGAA